MYKTIINTLKWRVAIGFGNVEFGQYWHIGYRQKANIGYPYIIYIIYVYFDQ